MTALAKVESTAALGLSGNVQLNGMGEVFKLAHALSKARGFVPDVYVGQPEALAAVILTGVELGLGPMQAMRDIHVIKGKPSLSATLMLSLARRAGVRTRWVKTDATTATIAVTVPGEPEQLMTFAEADAKAAGVWGQGNWKSYPAAMLRARCISSAIRAFCPDVIGGSVYESDSGEVSDGVPAEAIEAQIVTGTPEPKVAKKKLSDCASAAEVQAWCAANAEAVKDGGPKALAKVIEKADAFGVRETVVRHWLGLELRAELPDGSLTEDPPLAAG